MFKFIHQTSTIQKLLTQCIDALPYLPAQNQKNMLEALKPFETCTVPTVWSIEDIETIDLDNDHDLTDIEKLQVLNSFSKRYCCTQEDWEFLSDLVIETANNRHKK